MTNIDRSKYEVFEVIKAASKFDRSIFEFDYDDRMREYYRVWANKMIGYKTFYFTDKTIARVSAMDCTSLKAEDIRCICTDKTEKGVVLSGGENGLLNFGYIITPHHIIIGVYRGRIGSLDIVQYDNKQVDYSGFNSKWVGNIIINDNEITYNPNSLLTLLSKQDCKSLLQSMSKETKMRFMAMYKEMPKIRDIKTKSLLECSERDLEGAPITYAEKRAYFERIALLDVAMKMFLFLKTASVIEQTYISETPLCTYRRKQGIQTGYILVDSTWDADITVLNPFTVRGHFRHQPKKNEKGEWIRELIYIDAFMKKGYHRRAKKVIVEETNE